MNVKRYLLATLAVFVTGRILDGIMHGVILQATYKSIEHLWRPDMESKMWIYPVIALCLAPIFTYIFVKGYEGKGVMEGVRFGALMGLFSGLPFAYGSYAMIDIPYHLAFHWFLFSIAEFVIFGIVAALIYRPAPRAPAAAPAT